MIMSRHGALQRPTSSDSNDHGYLHLNSKQDSLSAVLFFLLSCFLCYGVTNCTVDQADGPFSPLTLTRT